MPSNRIVSGFPTAGRTMAWLGLVMIGAILLGSTANAWQVTGEQVNGERASANASDPEERIQKIIQQRGGDRADQWWQTYQSAPARYQAALAFQIEHMPPADWQQLSPEFLLENTRLAYQAWDAAPWKDQIPEAIFFNDILPYANIDETREDWRSDFKQKLTPLVADCKTPGEAAQVLNRKLFNLVGVHYSTARKKANQSPSESIEQGKASCTGLSILLVDACRSVGVPARLAGIPSWVNKRGNHTWVEIWDQGEWHFTGADEASDQGLNHTWFQADAKLALKDEPRHAIYAVSFQKTDTVFPMVWSRDGSRRVYAQNVTDRYTDSQETGDSTKETLLRVRVWNDGKQQRLVADVELHCLQCVGEPPETGRSTGNRADMNDLLQFKVIPGRTYRVVARHGREKVEREVKIDSSDHQLIELQISDGE